MKIIALLTLTLVLNSCSFSDSSKEEVASGHDDMEFAVDTLTDQPTNSDFQVEEQKIAETNVPDDYPSPSHDMEMSAPAEPTFKEFSRPNETAMTRVTANAEVEAPAKIKVEQFSQTIDHSETSYGEMDTYRVQKGDTLMMIAFKLYGDYRKWKDIKQWNKEKRIIQEGVELKYYVPEKKFGWTPVGLPYLIKTGDTLQIVSLDKYGTIKKWKSIYENNRPLIKDPDLIFAGFTIYYKPQRDLASEVK